MTKVYPKKPTQPRIRIIKHGSGYQVFDGNKKIQATTTLSRATESARMIERQYNQKIQYWLKHRRGTK